MKKKYVWKVARVAEKNIASKLTFFFIYAAQIYLIYELRAARRPMQSHVQCC